MSKTHKAPYDKVLDVDLAKRVIQDAGRVYLDVSDILSLEKAAKLLDAGIPTVSSYAQRGLLRRIYRGCFRREDVLALKAKGYPKRMKGWTEDHWRKHYRPARKPPVTGSDSQP